MKAEDVRTPNDLQQLNMELLQELGLTKKLTEIIDVEKGAKAGVLPLHEMHKTNDSILFAARQEGLTNLIEISKRLDEVFTDLTKGLYERNPDKKKAHQQMMLKKYGHNIPSVIKPNDMVLTLQHGVEDKNLLGNKGSNLVTMHKLGINVPTTLFLTTKMVKEISLAKNMGFYPILKNILNLFPEDKIAIRSSGVISMAGMMDTILDIDKNDDKAVQNAIADVIKSWDSTRAKQYRKMCKIEDEIKLAILIQPVIRGDKGYSGIFFTRDTNTGKSGGNGEYLKAQLGDGLASGTVTPQRIEAGKDKFPATIYSQLVESGKILEKHFKAIQDIEFVNDGEQTFIVQTRNAKLSPIASVKSLLDLNAEGIITSLEFKSRFNKKWLDNCKVYEIQKSEGLLFKGTGAVSGVVSGKVVFDKQKATEDTILITDFTTPNDLECINKVKGLIARIGGYTSHPAVICRELNKPCIIGVDKLAINEKSSTALYGDKIIREGEIITIIGDTGEVYLGEAKIEVSIKYFDKVTQILNSAIS